MKSKEPLMAVMLSFVITGLGQMYAGQIKKGIVFLVINIFAVIGMLTYLMNPATKLYSYMLAFIPPAILFGLYVIIDAYQNTKQYNLTNNLTRNITVGKRILLIIGILFFYMFNANSMLANYIRFNVVQAFRVSDDSMNPVLAKSDRILVNKASYKQSMPQRGDIIIFQYPGPAKRTSIKPLVALPGERVEMKEDGIYVNGNKIEYPELAGVDFYNRKAYDGSEAVREFDTPEGFYYLLDKKMGAVMPLNQLLGKAYKIYYPFDRSRSIK